MTGAHHVGEGQERRHERVVRADRKRDQRSVRLRDTDGFPLAAVERGAAPPSAVQAGRLQSLLAEFAGAIGPGERRDDQIALLHRSHIGADRLDDADELVAHPVSGLARRHRVVRPEIAAANTRTGDPNQGISRLDDPGVGNGFDAHIVHAIHHSRSHVIPSILGWIAVVGAAPCAWFEGHGRAADARR